MKRITTILFAAVLITGCQEESSTPEQDTEQHTHEQTTETNQEAETPVEIVQTNVVTPEFWESYDTDASMIFYYSKKESAAPKVHQIKEEILNGEAELGYQFHEYHTDENMGMVQVDDNVFFNLTEYLWNSEEGFVLLKKGGLLHIPAAELTEATFSESVAPFFE